VATATAREPGITCDECKGEFILGDEYLYFYGRKLHQGCASADAAARRDDGHDPVTAARAILDAGTRVILTRAQLRALVARAVELGLEPVRKPDTGRQQWYGRMPGWSAERVKGGLAASEVAGMWLDFVEAGRMPPLRGCDLSVIMDVIESAASIVTSPLSFLDPIP